MQAAAPSSHAVPFPSAVWRRQDSHKPRSGQASPTRRFRLTQLSLHRGAVQSHNCDSGQIGARHDQRLRSAPEPAQHVGDLSRRRVADDQRHDPERCEHTVQERQLDFESMFGRMRGIGRDNELQVRDAFQGSRIQRHAPERRLEGIDRRRRNPAHVDVMRRPDQHDLRDRVCASAAIGMTYRISLWTAAASGAVRAATACLKKSPAAGAGGGSPYGCEKDR